MSLNVPILKFHQVIIIPAEYALVMLPLEISLTNTVMSEAAREQRIWLSEEDIISTALEARIRCIFLEERSNYVLKHISRF